jgi:hypothetical protein
MPCIFRNRKRIIFATNIKSRSFYSSFDIARRYAKHRVEDYLYATENGADHGDQIASEDLKKKYNIDYLVKKNRTTSQ